MGRRRKNWVTKWEIDLGWGVVGCGDGVMRI